MMSPRQEFSRQLISSQRMTASLFIYICMCRFLLALLAGRYYFKTLKVLTNSAMMNACGFLSFQILVCSVQPHRLNASGKKKKKKHCEVCRALQYDLCNLKRKKTFFF